MKTPFEKMFLIVKIFCQHYRKRSIETKPVLVHILLEKPTPHLILDNSEI